MIHHDSDLLKYFIHFAQALRKRKVEVTIGNVLDVLRGISYIELQKKGDFYHLIRSNFISCKEEVQTFNEVFEQFWSLVGSTGHFAQKNLDEKADVFKEKGEPLSFESKSKQLSIKDWVDETEENGLKEDKDLPTYSPDEVLQQKDFIYFQAPELEKIKDLVSIFSRRLAVNLSRRWKKGRRVDRFDFRRSFRHSIKYGGEIIELKMKKPKPKPLWLILVCDVSGSMDIYGLFFLRFMHGLQNHYPHCETFTFSTRLSHITSLLKRGTFEQTLHLLSFKVLDWSGGTNIGAALHQLHQRHPDILHPNRSLLLIFSDGWDRGDTKLLDYELKSLKRQVKQLIWLNPLLSNQSYQPLCKGMSTALPYVDHFLPYYNFWSLKKVGHLISRI